MAGIDLSIDISTFPARIDQRRIQLKKGLNLLSQNVVREVVRRLARETPVDTGEARSNWLVSIGSPRTEVIAPYNRLPKRKDNRKFRERSNANGVITAAEKPILRFRPGNKEQQILWIVNNTEHIADLNAGILGRNPQVSPRFVEKAVKEGTLLGFRKSKGFLFTKGRILAARAAVKSGLRSIQ